MKKLLSLVLVLSLVLGSVGFAFAAPAEDVVGLDCEDAATRLAGFEIMKGYPDGTFKPENNITRAEFAALVVRALGEEDTAMLLAGSDTGFTDVTANEAWASGYILLASQKGIINGYGNGMFGPNDNIKYVDALVMLVRALGYTPEADAKGGYPSGYVAVANKLDLTDDITAAPLATRCMVAIAIDNALSVEFMEQKTFGDTEEYEVASGTGMLVELGLEDYAGIVDYTPGFGGLDDDMVELVNYGTEFEIMESAGVNPDDLIGREVTLWANDDDEVLLVEIETEMTIVVPEVELNDDKDAIEIGDDEYEFAEDETIYIVANREDAESFGTSIAALEGEDVVLFINDDGEITSFLWTTDNSSYADDFDDNKRVDEVDEAREKISYKTGTTDNWDFDDDDVLFMNGTEFVSLEDINEDDVLTVIETDTNEYLVKVFDTAYEGKVTRYSSSKDELTIDGTIVDLDGSEVKDGFTDYADLLGEDDVLVLMGRTGYVAYVDADNVETDSFYAVLMATGEEDSRGDVTPWVKLFTADGEEVVYDTDTDEIETLSAVSYTSQTAYVVEYELNNDGEVTTFAAITTDTAATYTFETSGDYLFYDEGDSGYDPGEERYEVTEDTVLFGWDTDEDEWVLAELRDGNDYYTEAETDDAEVVAGIVEGTYGEAGDADLAVFDEAAEIVDAYEVVLWVDGVDETFDTEDDDVDVDWSYGDLVEYSLSGGKVTEIVEYDYDVVVADETVSDIDGDRVYYNDDADFFDADDDTLVYYIDDSVDPDDIEAWEIGDLDAGMTVDFYFNSDDELEFIIVTDDSIE